MAESEEMLTEFREILVDSFGFIGTHILTKQMRDLHLDHGITSPHDALKLIEKLYEVTESFSGPAVAHEIKKKLRKTASKYVDLTDLENMLLAGGDWTHAR